ncbi:MAG: hypothetical protein JWP69_2121 [Flaviaesturariibacter sp.]|nr:hypothetical protein [Flaviaesturariibacter sp.]
MFLVISTAYGQGNVTSNKEEELIEYFADLDLESFEGKTAESFLRSLKPAYKKFSMAPSRNHLYRGVLVFTYDYGIEVEIYLDEFRFANPNGICRKRNRGLAGKEIISTIQVHNGIACIQGCT